MATLLLKGNNQNHDNDSDSDQSSDDRKLMDETSAAFDRIVTISRDIHPENEPVHEPDQIRAEPDVPVPEIKTDGCQPTHNSSDDGDGFPNFMDCHESLDGPLKRKYCHDPNNTSHINIQCSNCNKILNFVEMSPNDNAHQYNSDDWEKTVSKKRCDESQLQHHMTYQALNPAGGDYGLVAVAPYIPPPPPPINNQTFIQQVRPQIPPQIHPTMSTIIQPPYIAPPPRPTTTPPYFHEFVYNETARAFIIGPRGANMREIGTKYKVRIHLKTSENDRNYISGTPAACFKALGDIKQLELDWLEKN